MNNILNSIRSKTQTKLNYSKISGITNFVILLTAIILSGKYLFSIFANFGNVSIYGRFFWEIIINSISKYVNVILILAGFITFFYKKNILSIYLISAAIVIELFLAVKNNNFLQNISLALSIATLLSVIAITFKKKSDIFILLPVISALLICFSFIFYIRSFVLGYINLYYIIELLLILILGLALCLYGIINFLYDNIENINIINTPKQKNYLPCLQ